MVDLQVVAPWCRSEMLFCPVVLLCGFNTLKPRQDGRRFPDDTCKRIFLNENVIILIKISLKFVLIGPINNIPALVKIMAWRRPGDKPLSESMMVNLLTHICVARPQWVKTDFIFLLCMVTWLMELISPTIFETLKQRQNGLISQMTFSKAFLEWKYMNFDRYFTEVYS